MIKLPIAEWSKKLRASSKLVQDDDDSVPPEKAEQRFNEYVKLVGMVTGKETQEVFQALVDSIRVPEDYGAYEAVHNALWKFPPENFAHYFISALPKFIRRMAKHDQVARFLMPLTGHGRRKYLPAFASTLSKASASDRKTILNFIQKNCDELGEVSLYESKGK